MAVEFNLKNMIVDYKTELEKEWYILNNNIAGLIEKGSVLSYEDSVYTIEKFQTEASYLDKCNELNIEIF